MARGRARRSWRPGSRVAFAVRGQPPRAASEGRLGAHRGPGKPCLNRLSTCGGRRIPVSLSKWDNQDEAHSRGRELLPDRLPLWLERNRVVLISYPRKWALSSPEWVM